MSDKILDKAKDNKFGQMAPCTKAGGWIIKLMVKEDLSTLTEMFMTDSGWMTKHMDLESIVISTEPNTKVTGKKINNTETVLKHGLMVQSTKANMFKVKSTVLVNSHGLMAVLITETSLKITFKEKESIIGLTAENIMVIG